MGSKHAGAAEPLKNTVLSSSELQALKQHRPHPSSRRASSRSGNHSVGMCIAAKSPPCDFSSVLFFFLQVHVPRCDPPFPKLPDLIAILGKLSGPSKENEGQDVMCRGDRGEGTGPRAKGLDSSPHLARF